MASLESESTAPLSYVQLRAAARKIPFDKIVPVARNLELSDEDLTNVRYLQQQLAVRIPADEYKWLVLEVWKRKDPDNCTLEKLLKALRDSELNNTILQVRKAVNEAVNGSREEEEQIMQDEKCESRLEITERMANKVSTVMKCWMYSGLGFELGLSPLQMDVIEARPDRIASNYIREVLMCWRELDGENAVLGRLYKALRMLQYNNTAKEVFQKCAHTEQTDDIDLT